MGTTLASTQIRNTYSGLLKTTDNSTVGGTLKTVSDGAGNDTALRVSTNEVNVSSLSVESVSSGPSLTKMLMWNDSTKDVQYRNYNPTGVTAFNTDSIVGGNGGATVQIDASTAVLTINAGSNIQITGGGSSIDISTSLGDAAENVNFTMTEATTGGVDAGDFYTSIIYTFTDYEGTNTISRVRGARGVDVTSEANTDGGRDFTIDAGRQTRILQVLTASGAISNSTSQITTELPPLLDLTEETAADLMILVNASQMNKLDQVQGNMNQRTVTLPPPYPGRRIKIVFTSVPSVNLGGGKYGQGMDHPIRFAVANQSSKDGVFRNTGFFGRGRLNASNPTNDGNSSTTPGRFGRATVGYTDRKDYLYFQDINMLCSADPHVGNVNAVLAIAYSSFGETSYGLANGDQITMVAVDDKAYMCDIVTYAPYNVRVQGNYQVFNSGNYVPTPTP